MSAARYSRELSELIEKCPHSWANLLKSTHKFVQDDIMQSIDEKFKDCSSATRVYVYLNDIHDWPSCAICGKKLVRCSCTKDGFQKTCKSSECMNKYKHLKTIEACKAKYGVENVYSLRSTIEKTRRTKIARYGSTGYCNQEKAKKTCLERYGVENAAQAEEVKARIKKTCLKKYGTEYAFQSQKVKDKIKKTSLERYGVENPGASNEALSKIKKTFQQRYGKDFQCVGDMLRLDSVKAKIRAKSLERYGTAWPTSSEQAKKAQEESCLRKYGCKNHTTYAAYNAMLQDEWSEPMFTLQQLDGLDSWDKLEFRCKRCGNAYKAKHSCGVHMRCPSCFPKSLKSYEEDDVLKFVKAAAGDDKVISNDRKMIAPYELDMYIPSRKLAIEFDGLFWHSMNKDGSSFKRRYHLMKTQMCEEKGIQLVHIFENEWLFKKDIVKSRLNDLLGIYSKTIFARRCIVKEVSSQESVQFQDDNHLQGSVAARVNIGLFFDAQLVSLMAFGKPRFSKTCDWELLRFCNKINCHVPGAASKLLKHFEEVYKPKSIVSYADRRWSQGKLYKALGFQLDHASPPNYWYYSNNCELESRVKFQKHKLKLLLKKFDPSKTEIENMQANGYFQVYDCGNLVFMKRHDNNLKEMKENAI